MNKICFVALGLLIAGVTGAEAKELPSVSEVIQFMDAASPRLYVGSDERGSCRLLVYSEQNSNDSKIWLEGTFQAESGPVAGFPIVFMLSSDPTRSLVNEAEITESNFSAVVTYPSQSEEDAVTQAESSAPEQIAVYVTKDAGAISSVTYQQRNTKRSCQGLKRIL